MNNTDTIATLRTMKHFINDTAARDLLRPSSDEASDAIDFAIATLNRQERMKPDHFTFIGGIFDFKTNTADAIQTHIVRGSKVLMISVLRNADAAHVYLEMGTVISVSCDPEFADAKVNVEEIARWRDAGR